MPRRLRLRKPREQGRPLLGLALGGGALRGATHIGVLEALDSAGLRPDIVTGTSVGAIVGGLYAAGQDVSELRQSALTFNQAMLAGDRGGAGHLVRYLELALDFLGVELGRFQPSESGFASGLELEQWIAKVTPVMTVEELSLPFAATATDVVSGETVLFSAAQWIKRPLPPMWELMQEVMLHDALRCSATIPVLLEPKRLRNRWLVDGGVVQPVPVQVCKLMGADVVVGVDLSRSDRPGLEVKTGPGWVRSQVVDISTQNLTRNLLAQYADLAVYPQVADEFSDWSMAVSYFVKEGRRAMRDKIPQLEELMENRQRGCE